MNTHLSFELLALGLYRQMLLPGGHMLFSPYSTGLHTLIKKKASWRLLVR